MKPLVVLGCSLALAVAIGCENPESSPLKVNPGNSIVSFHVAGAS